MKQHLFINIKNAIVRRIFLIIFMSLLIITSFVQCKKQQVSRLFYVNELGLYIQINEIGNNLYRIYINNSADHIGVDYIDVSYKISEMPSITLNFPLDNSGDINVVERYDYSVKNWNSENYNFVYPDIDINEFKERFSYLNWCDSVMYETPSISVEVCAYLADLWVFDNNKKSGRKISQYN